MLKPNVAIQLAANAAQIEIPKKYSNVFLFNPSQQLQNQLAETQKFKAELLFKHQQSLWRIDDSQNLLPKTSRPKT